MESLDIAFHPEDLLPAIDPPLSQDASSLSSEGVGSQEPDSEPIPAAPMHTLTVILLQPGATEYSSIQLDVDAAATLYSLQQRGYEGDSSFLPPLMAIALQRGGDYAFWRVDLQPNHLIKAWAPLTAFEPLYIEGDKRHIYIEPTSLRCHATRSHTWSSVMVGYYARLTLLDPANATDGGYFTFCLAHKDETCQEVLGRMRSAYGQPLSMHRQLCPLINPKAPSDSGYPEHRAAVVGTEPAFRGSAPLTGVFVFTVSESAPPRPRKRHISSFSSKKTKKSKKKATPTTSEEELRRCMSPRTAELYCFENLDLSSSSDGEAGE